MCLRRGSELPEPLQNHGSEEHLFPERYNKSILSRNWRATLPPASLQERRIVKEDSLSSDKQSPRAYE